MLELLSELGIKRVSRRSEYSGAAPPDSAIDVFLLDTLGELSQAYAFAQAAYVGGTLCGPGHNVIEPLEWGVPVAFGPGRGKPTSEQQSCIEAGVGFCVRDEQQLADLWLSAVQNQAWREQLKNDSQRILQEQRQALTNNVAAIVEMLSTPPAK